MGACRGLPVAWAPRAGAVWGSTAVEMFWGKGKEEPIKRRHLSSPALWPQNRVFGAEPLGPPTGKSPRLQATQRRGLRQQECPPKTPRGESAVASLPAENPKVAPGRGRGGGREADLGSDFEPPPVVRPIPCPGGRRGPRPHRGFPDSPRPLACGEAAGAHRPVLASRPSRRGGGDRGVISRPALSGSASPWYFRDFPKLL